MIPLEFGNLIDQARLNATVVNSTIHQFEVTLITPVSYVKVIGMTGMGGLCNYVNKRSDDIRINLRIQPGVYQKSILPYKDDLELELITTLGTRTFLKKFRCIPLAVNDTEIIGNSSKEIDLSIYDDLNFIDITFQLMDFGFSKLRTIPYSNTFLLANVKDVIHHVLSEETKRLGLRGRDEFKGVNLELPVDNEVVYRQIKFPQGETLLINICQYLQNGDYGVYSRGLGSYYKEGRWWVYSLWNSNKYENSDKVLDIIRVPEDVIPTIEQTCYVNDTNVTILSTGRAELHNSSDVNSQNEGSGEQLISNKAALGLTGTHTKNGKTILTRKDTLVSYQTTDRQSGENRINVNTTPTNNVAKSMSKYRMANGEILVVPWHNGDPDLLYPGMPFRYYYLTAKGVLKKREGTLISSSYEYQPTSNLPDLKFYCHLNLTLFVGLEETNV